MYPWRVTWMYPRSASWDAAVWCNLNSFKICPHQRNLSQLLFRWMKMQYSTYFWYRSPKVHLLTERIMETLNQQLLKILSNENFISSGSVMVLQLSYLHWWTFYYWSKNSLCTIYPFQFSGASPLIVEASLTLVLGPGLLLERIR